MRISQNTTRLSSSRHQRHVLFSYVAPLRLGIHISIILLSLIFIPVNSRHLFLSSNYETPTIDHSKYAKYQSELRKKSFVTQFNEVSKEINNPMHEFFDGYPSDEVENSLKTLKTTQLHHELDLLKVHTFKIIEL